MPIMYTRRLSVLLTLLVIASEAPAKVHSNSATMMPYHITTAGVYADGLARYIGYSQDATGFELSVAEANSPLRPRIVMDSHAYPEWNGMQIDKLWTGRFTDAHTNADSICFRSKFNRDTAWSRRPIYCFVTAALYTDPPKEILLQVSNAPSPVEWTLDNSQYLVGDFDGDGYDELLTYNPYSHWGANIHIFKYNRGTNQFEVAPIDLGNLAGFVWEGMIQIHAGNFADFPGEGRRDDLLIYNTTTGQVARFDARVSAGRSTFWWAFTTSPSSHNMMRFALPMQMGTGWRT